MISVDFSKVNDAVLIELRRWLDATVEQILKNWSEDEKGDNWRAFLNNAALYFRRRGKHERAITLSRELVRLDEADKSRNMKRVIISKKNLATALRSFSEARIQDG